MGIEACKKRVDTCYRMMDSLTTTPSYKTVPWRQLITFKHEDSCSSDGPFVDEFGNHCSHIFCYNWLLRRVSTFMK
jgi:hypothetical protein